MEQALKYGSSAVTMAQKIVTGHCPKAVTTAAAWTAENPALAACAIVGTTSVTFIAVPALASGPLLSAVGFGAGGVKAGTLAAIMHGGIGNAVASTPFAIAQSAGAGGAGLAVVNGVTQICAGVITASSGGLAWMKSKS